MVEVYKTHNRWGGQRNRNRVQKKRTHWLKKGSVRGSAVVTRKIGVKSTFYQKQAEKQKRRPEIKVKKKRRGTRKISGPVVFFVGGEWKVKNLKGHKLINH